jgi:hypothetical protein
MFAKIGIIWSLISPLAAILSSAVFVVPFIRNRLATTSLGIITTIVGFVSSYLQYPLLDAVSIGFTVTGALFTVIGIGSAEPKEKDSENSE